MMPRIDAFLLGVIVTAAIAVGVFFLKFWRDTRDSLFLAFGVAFILEGINRATMLTLAKPNEGSPWNYGVRLIAFLIILAGIVGKNREKSG